MSKQFPVLVATLLLTLPSSNAIAGGGRPKGYSVQKDQLHSMVHEGFAQLFGKNYQLDEVQKAATNTAKKIAQEYGPHIASTGNRDDTTQIIVNEAVSFVLDEISKHAHNNPAHAQRLSEEIIQLVQNSGDLPHGVFYSYVGQPLKQELAPLYPQQNNQQGQTDTDEWSLSHWFWRSR